MTTANDSDETALREEAESYLYAFKTSQRPVIDRFLLAIIDKHPVMGSDREKRLLDAKHALLGMEKRGRGSKDDTELLMEMARRFVELEGDEDTDQEVSIRELASEVAEYTPGQSTQSTADRIRKKFDEICLRKQRLPKSRKRRLSEFAHGLILMDSYGMGEDDTWEACDLQELLNALKLPNIPVVEPTEY